MLEGSGEERRTCPGSETTRGGCAPGEAGAKPGSGLGECFGDILGR